MSHDTFNPAEITQTPPDEDQQIADIVAKAIDDERARCAEIVQLARADEIGRDWRTIIHFIESGMSLAEIKLATR